MMISPSSGAGLRRYWEERMANVGT